VLAHVVRCARLAGFKSPRVHFFTHFVRSGVASRGPVRYCRRRYAPAASGASGPVLLTGPPTSPTRPDDQTFVEGDYFEVTGFRRWQKILTGCLPRIETKQDDQIFATAAHVNKTDTELVQTLLTDGGETSPRGGWLLPPALIFTTVYRAFKRRSPLVEHTNGEVQLGSKYIA